MQADKLALIKEYYKNIRVANKELTKKEIFKDLLNRLYYNDKNILSVIDSITRGAECTILNIPRKDSLHRGQADSLFNKVIIEFENDLKLTLAHAKEQLAGYLLGQYNSGEGYNFTLIASDFITWRVFAPDVSCIDKLEQLSEEQLNLNEVPSASIILNDKNGEEFYYWLDRFLFKEEKQRATLKRIEEAFGNQSNIFLECYRELNRNFSELKKYGEVQVSYEQWSKFLSFAYGSFDANEDHFLIHTYLSVFAKMLAYAVVSNDDYIDDDELKGILDGSIFHKYNLRNFVDNDFFHWVKSERNFNRLKKVFRLIAQEIAAFDFTSVDEDILKGVYQELIDLDTRHTLGEYYTPDWLCERIVREFSFKPHEKVLDPACGSGSFLRAMVHRFREMNPSMSAEEVNNNVYGIDIHPLSVLIAKTTMLLALGKDIVRAKKPVHINVILANTLLAPDGVETLFGSEFKMTIDKDKLVLNSHVLDDVELFDEAIEVCEELAEQTMNSAPVDSEVFGKILQKRYTKFTIGKTLIQSFYLVYNSFKNVKEEGRNGIWKFVVQNLYKPYFLSKKFSYVIGNPPWFTYSSIKNEEYQNELNALAEKHQVKPDRVANFPHLEIAAIFMAYCSDYFLQKTGKLAFVLPRSFFSADHHENTRSGKALGFKIEQLWDLNEVSPLFRIPSAVIFTRPAEENAKRSLPVAGLPGKTFSGKLPVHNCTLEKAGELLTEEIDTWYYSKQGRSSAFSRNKGRKSTMENPYKMLFHQGATIVPRTFYFVELTQETPPDFDDRIINIKTAEAIKTDAKQPWKEISFAGRIESKFLFRTAISKSILPFALYKPDLVALPVIIEQTDTGKKIKLLNSNELRSEGYLHAAKWFKDAENIWGIHRTEKSKGMESYDRLNFQKGLTGQDINTEHLVLYNSSAKDANATVVKRSQLDMNYFVESTTYVLYTSESGEAYYLSTILNSVYTNELIKDFQARGLFGARHVHKKILDIYYPKYDDKDPAHQSLAALGAAAHEKTKQYLLANPPQLELTAIHLGRLRTAIKKHLAQELKEIDSVVKKLIG